MREHILTTEGVAEYLEVTEGVAEYLEVTERRPRRIAQGGKNDARRLLLRCELDAAFFHLYLGSPAEWQEAGTPELREAFPTPRDAVDYILETPS